LSIELLARDEIRRLQPYQTARQVKGMVRLNANEAPWSGDGSNGDGLNRYPEIRPVKLQARLAAHYSVRPGMVLATRGSSEAIDLLMRVFCRAGIDNVVTSPPTFAMYRVYADIQGAGTIHAPLLAEHDFGLDVALVLEKCTPDTKLVFVCSPNNPTGGLVPVSSISELAEERANRSLIVVDEAYAEYADAPSAATLLGEHDNVVVLRTLSKAHSLAGARCGAVLASENLICLLNCVLAPYALATPVISCVLNSLAEENLRRSRSAVQRVLVERERVSRELALSPDVMKVWPSRSNFILVRFRELAPVEARLSAAGILVRPFGHEPSLRNCARITIGKPAENDLLLEAIGRSRRTA
jgi:histidinol-phosphate aminotransferase